ncbi:MAG: KTSC domain-containing protein [Acinetobacter populi]|jgi:hypothetical protein|uniref:KTSC domain-containing protein n=1 Tax=Acinetobacter populi TaxID=1582270 RepID=UPI002353EC0F|nr:KTSC domain-containing protein [Acinetobacter populi]MCH4249035.1 KTSC domain-containing protein [Acinetobacter populi]
MLDLQVTMFKYDASSRCLKLFYSDGSGAIFKSVPEFVHRNLLRCEDKAAFVQKYLEYDLHFTKITLMSAA